MHKIAFKKMEIWHSEFLFLKLNFFTWACAAASENLRVSHRCVFCSCSDKRILIIFNLDGFAKICKKVF